MQENVRRFNQEEAIWQCYEEKRKRRRRLFRMRSKIAEKLLDRLDWAAAEGDAPFGLCWETAAVISAKG